MFILQKYAPLVADIHKDTVLRMVVNRTRGKSINFHKLTFYSYILETFKQNFALRRTIKTLGNIRFAY